MDELSLLRNYLTVGSLVFGIGLVGFLSRRNLIVMFLSAEMMLQGVSLNLVAWSRYHGDWGGQMLVVFIIAVAACEAAIMLALVLVLYRRSGNLDAITWQETREANQPKYVDQEIPEPPGDESVWPQLTPAGVEPEIDPDDVNYRVHV